ncbi:MAG: fumarate hydratase [Actinobacteria bacterium]|nr:fumarate hydratase [Actinomycetota bacterium]
MVKNAYQIFKKEVIKANTVLPQPVRNLLNRAIEEEDNKDAIKRLKILIENALIAEEEKRPICQDTGIVNVFVFLPEGVCLPEGFYGTLNMSIYDAYKESGFRFSTVNPPIIDRRNDMTNKPAFLKIIDAGFSDVVRIVFMPKGAGSENASFIKMFKPTTSFDDLLEDLSKRIVEKARFSCPPVIAGISIGGTFDSAPLKAKLSLLEAGLYTSEIAKEIKERINKSGIGPFGLGGLTTALDVTVNLEPTHIASLPVAVSMSCHALRYSICEFKINEWQDLKFEVF